jgi:L-alanine-DL-glutamate epimerase-like enolase superfamily enzyme
VLESIRKWDGFHADILKSPMRWEEGYVIPPKTPGLGVELNEEVALAHPYEGDELHLQMSQNPFEVAGEPFAGG